MLNIFAAEFYKELTEGIVVNGDLLSKLPAANNNNLVEENIDNIPPEVEEVIKEVITAIYKDIKKIGSFLKNEISKKDYLNFKDRVNVIIEIFYNRKSWQFRINDINNINDVIYVNTLPLAPDNLKWRAQVRIDVYGEVFDGLGIDFIYKKLGNLILKSAVIEALFINEEKRRKGYGKKLFNFLKTKLNLLTIVIEGMLTKAQAFYYKNDIWYVVITPINKEIYEYIKEELKLELVSYLDVYPEIKYLKEIIPTGTYERISDVMLMRPTEENIKNYYINKFIKNVNITVNNGVWINRELLGEIVNKIKKYLKSSKKINVSTKK